MSRPTPPALMLLAGTYKHPHKGFWSHYIHDEDGVKQISFRQEHVSIKNKYDHTPAYTSKKLKPATKRKKYTKNNKGGLKDV